MALSATNIQARRFHFLVTKRTDPAANLAMEQEFLREVDRGARPETVRLWINAQCLVRGPHRSHTSGWYHEERARELGVSVYTRSTGGGCVYHDRGNLNWSFYLRQAGSYVGYAELFRWCSAFVIEALRALDIDASFGAPNRIDVGGRKVSGLAARALRNAGLVHGTLLIATDLQRVEELCIPPLGCPPVARICDFNPSLTVEHVIGSIKEVVMNRLGSPIEMVEEEGEWSRALAVKSGAV
jgi:lipoate-protein ligase A